MGSSSGSKDQWVKDIKTEKSLRFIQGSIYSNYRIRILSSKVGQSGLTSMVLITTDLSSAFISIFVAHYIKWQNHDDYHQNPTGLYTGLCTG